MSFKQLAKLFSGLSMINSTYRKAVTDIIYMQSQVDKMYTKLESIDISKTAGQRVLKFAKQKYSETPETFKHVQILDRLYMHGCSGLNEDDAIIMTKADIIKDIQEKNIARRFGKYQIQLFGDINWLT